MKKQRKRVVPAFTTEAEEASWWYQNRKIHDKELLAAVKSGEAQVLTREKLLQRIAASRKTPSPVVSLRIPAADLLESRPKRRGCRTRATSSHCYTRLSPSAKEYANV
jgi:hypothetical protein